MKAYELELKVKEYKNTFTGELEKDKDGNVLLFKYREQLWQIVRSTSNKEGLSTEEMLRRAELMTLLEQAKDAEVVHFNTDQFNVLKDIVDTAHWTLVDGLVAAFISDIKSSKQVDLEVVAKAD